MSSRITSTSLNCARNFFHAGTGSSAVNSLRPYCSSRVRASVSLKPRLRVRTERGEDRIHGLLIWRRLVAWNWSSAHIFILP